MSNDERIRVAVVAPAFNESGKIGRVVRKVRAAAVRGRKVLLEPVVVDDSSTDGTAEQARKEGATVLRHDQNQGVGAGIRTGIDYALAAGHDIVVIVAGDDQHEPDEIHRVLMPLLSDRCDFVQGSRWLPGGEAIGVTLFRRITTQMYGALVRLATGKPCTDGTNGFRAFRTALLDDTRINLWQECLNRYELEPYLLYKVLTLGYRVQEVPITIRYHSRRIGFTKMRPFRDWWRLIRPLLYLWLGKWT